MYPSTIDVFKLPIFYIPHHWQSIHWWYNTANVNHNHNVITFISWTLPYNTLYEYMISFMAMNPLCACAHMHAKHPNPLKFRCFACVHMHDCMVTLIILIYYLTLYYDKLKDQRYRLLRKLHLPSIYYTVVVVYSC